MLTQGTRPGNGPLCYRAGGAGRAVTYRMTVPDVTAQGVLRLRERSFGPGQLVIMARVGRTPDSRGPARDTAAAMDRVHAVVAEGADLVDLGGGPARPGTDLGGGPARPGTDLGGGPAAPGTEVTAAEEIRWAVPLVASVRAAYPDLVIGVGARRYETARELCAAGADLLRDHGERLSEVAAEYGAGLVCGNAERAVARGVDPSRVVIEADMGSWPWPWASPEATRRLEDTVAAGWPVLVSVPWPSQASGPAGSLAAAAVWAWLGARVFRADQVTQTRRVLDMVSAIRGDRPPAHALRGLA
jgi:dihydropteroate synthase